MKVEFRPLAKLRSLLPEADRESGRTLVEARQGATLAELLEGFGLGPGMTLVVLVNGRYAPPGSALNEGDVVSVFPPVAGG